MDKRVFICAVALIMAACGGTETAATVVPTASPTVIQQTPLPPTPTSAATVAAASVALTATATTSGTDWVNTASVDGDFYVRGNPKAPVRLIDYSDFL